MKVRRNEGVRLAFWVGLLLPIPVFLEFDGGSPGLASGAGTAIPISFVLMIPILVYLARRPRQIQFIAERNLAAFIVVVVTATLFVASAAVAIRGSFQLIAFALQWSLPLVYAILGFVLMQRASEVGRLARGLVAGMTFAVIFVLVAWIIDWKHFVASGRIDQFTPPIPGMYQVGNYTPAGLFLCGCLTLSMCSNLPLILRRFARLVASCAMILAVVLFGAREVLVSAGVTAMMGAVLLLRTARGARRLFIVPAMLAPILSVLGVTQVASIDRFNTAAGIRELLAGREATVSERGLGLFDGQSSLFGELIVGNSLYLDGRSSRSSSHNAYLDLTVDFGVVGVVIAVTLIGLFVAVGSKSWFAVLSEPRAARSGGTRFWLSAAVITFGLVSANVNLPLAQPYTAAVGYLALGLLIGFRTRRLHVRSDEYCIQQPDVRSNPC